MLHEVMQTCLATGHWDEQYIDERIDEVVTKGLSELVKLDTSVEQAKREMKLRAKGLQAFARKYVADTPQVRVDSVHLFPLTPTLYYLARSHPHRHAIHSKTTVPSCDIPSPRRRRRHLVAHVRPERQDRRHCRNRHRRP